MSLLLWLGAIFALWYFGFTGWAIALGVILGTVVACVVLVFVVGALGASKAKTFPRHQPPFGHMRRRP